VAVSNCRLLKNMEEKLTDLSPSPPATDQIAEVELPVVTLKGAEGQHDCPHCGVSEGNYYIGPCRVVTCWQCGKPYEIKRI